MNTSVRAYARPRAWSQPRLSARQMWVVWMMMALLLLSALGIVFVKDRYRRSYLSYKDSQQQVYRLSDKHDRLLVESATRLSQDRLATLAKAQGMVVPSSKKTVWLRDKSS